MNDNSDLLPNLVHEDAFEMQMRGYSRRQVDEYIARCRSQIRLDDLRSLVEPSTRGDPQASLLWTAKSLRNLAGGLCELGHRISYSAVREVLRSLGYSLQANCKTREGGNHPDRDEI